MQIRCYGENTHRENTKGREKDNAKSIDRKIITSACHSTIVGLKSYEIEKTCLLYLLVYLPLA